MHPLRKRDHMRIFFDSIVDKIRIFRTTKKQNKTTPWESWELDPAFFKALSQWTLDNPDNTLDNFLKRAIDGVNIAKELLEMIPDSPVPIRGFFKALAHLVKLGGAVGRAQREVYEFARYIIHWVGNIESAFQSKELGPTTLQLQKRYLREMRTLIDEICIWAVARLDDRRWSFKGILVEKEINDFKTRIAAARVLFVDVAVIITAKNQDLQLQAAQSLISTIQDIRLSQENILAFLEEQRNETEQHKKETERRKFLDDIFLHHAADKTAYEEQGKRPCDDGTRVEILRDIKAWIFDISENTQRFLWLTGDPGSGKSAITASITRECKDNNILWAQFFINRNLAGTTDPASYFPSIASQLADRSPEVSLAIFNTLKAKPSLIDSISQDQAGRLFVDSLKVASSVVSTKPIVVTIDGLDETDTNQLQTTADIFAKAMLDLPKNVKIFISSRTEDEIRRPFHSTFTRRLAKVKHVHLDTSSESSTQDVSRFLKKGIVRIAQQNDLDVLRWPGKKRLDILCKRAAGLFIWAVTVIGFIETEVKESGREILDSILDSLTASDLADINILYGAILRMMFRGRKDPWKVDRFRKIVGCLVVLREPLCIHDITLLLDLRNPDSNEPVDILNFFIRLRTILVSGVDIVTPQTVPRLHKSFYEFITSESADQYIVGTGSALPLHVKIREAEDNIAMQCLSFIESSHIPRSRAGPAPSDLVSQAPGIHSRTQDLLLNSPLLRYSSNYTMSHWGKGTGILTLSALILPEFDNSPNSQTAPPNSSRRTYTDNMNCATISPNGRYLASGSSNVILLQDISTGAFIGSPFEGHTRRVWAVAFSPDGKLLVSGSHDHTLLLWDVESGQQIAGPLTYHTGNVNSVAFSADGKRIVSGSDDKTVHVWNLDSREAVNLSGHTGTVRAVAFSPQTPQLQEYIISGSHDMTIRLWDCSRRNVEYVKSFTGHTAYVLSVAFAPAASFTKSMQFISGSLDLTVRLWNIDMESCIRVFRGHTSSVWSVVFSLDSKQIISGSLDKMIHVWDLKTGNSVAQANHTEQVRGVACHGRLIASSLDSGVQIWVKKTSPDTSATLVPLYNFDDTLVSVSVSPDCRNIATAFSNRNILVRQASATIYMPLIAPSYLAAAENGPIALTFSPDGDILAAVYPGNNVCLWSMETEQVLMSYVLLREIPRSPKLVSFSPDGNHLITFGIDGSYETWDASNGGLITTNTEGKLLKAGEVGRAVTLDGSYTWHPLNTSGFGLCMAADVGLIRIDGNGVICIIPIQGGMEARAGHPLPSADHPTFESKQSDRRPSKPGEQIFIAATGPKGSGKSSFIARVTGEDADIGHTQETRATDIITAKITCWTRSDYEITFIDTPGLDSEEKSDIRLWKIISHQLMRIYRRKDALGGIIYLHPARDPSLSPNLFRDMGTFRELCGDNVPRNIVFTTTTWRDAPVEMSEDAEDPRRGRQWKAMRDRGASIAKWTGTAASAWGVVDRFVDAGNNHYAALLRSEMFELKTQLGRTDTGLDLYSALEHLTNTQRGVLDQFRARIKEPGADKKTLDALAKAEYGDVQRWTRVVVDEIQALRLPMRPKLLPMLFSEL